jgi:hypothetical protein
MKLVKAIAILIVPLLLTSFLAVMPVAFASKPMPFTLVARWDYVAAGPSFGYVNIWYTGPTEHYIWAGHFDLFSAEDTAYLCPLGTTDMITEGVISADGKANQASSKSTFIIANSCSGSNPLDSKTGTLVFNSHSGGGLTYYNWEISGGTGDLAGIHGKGIDTLTGTDAQYFYYTDIGTIHFTG